MKNILLFIIIIPFSFFCQASKKNVLEKINIEKSALARISFSYNNTGSIIKIAEDGVILSSEINDSSNLSFFYNTLGEAHKLNENYNKSILNFYKSLHFLNQKNKHQKALLHLKIANLYRLRDKISKAKGALNTGTLLAKEINDSSLLIQTYLTEGLLKFEELKFEESKNSLSKSLNFSLAIKDSTNMANIENSIGYAKMQTEETNSALSHFLKAISISQKQTNFNSLAYAYTNTGLCYLKLNNIDSAILYINKSIKCIENNNLNLVDKINLYQNISDFFENQTKSEEALKYKKLYFESTLNFETANKTEDYLELEKYLLQHNKKRQTKKDNLFFIIITCLLLLLAIVTSIYLYKRKTTNKRQQKLSFDNFNLTKRETEIAKLLLQGMSSPQIGEMLFISVNTVNSHKKRIYKKLKISSSFELITQFNN